MSTLAETMLVRRGDVVHVRGCERAVGAKVTPVYSTTESMRFCALCGAEPLPRVAAGSLVSSTVGLVVAVPATPLDEAFTGRVVSVAHEVGLSGCRVTSLTFEPVWGRARVLTVDSAVRVEVRS